MYKELEVEVIGFKNEITKTTIVKENISHYRPFTDTDDKMGSKPKIATVVYMISSVKSIKVNCSYDDFKKKLKEAE